MSETVKVGDRVWRYYDATCGDPGIYAGIVDRILPSGECVMVRPGRAEGFRSAPHKLHVLPPSVDFLWAEAQSVAVLLAQP